MNMENTVPHICHQMTATFYTSDCKKSRKHLLTCVSKLLTTFSLPIVKKFKHLLTRVSNLLTTFLQSEERKVVSKLLTRVRSGRCCVEAPYPTRVRFGRTMSKGPTMFSKQDG